MKKISAFIVLLLFSVSISFAQKSKTDKSEKFYSKNWKIVKSDDNPSWSSLKPDKRAVTRVNSSKSKVINSVNSHSKSTKTKKSTYPSTINNTLTNRGAKKSGSLKKARTTTLKSIRKPIDKKKLFSKKNN
ncbi:MAG: hypothetical protein ACI914_000342 [Candidatus Marivariicella framensis]|mgnify:FL=1|jgi:hypothetical protein|tara:strand:- start:5519 stop:5911 length:393 start_codon:yes stop_codon:yes gene_type:complete